MLILIGLGKKGKARSHLPDLKLTPINTHYPLLIQSTFPSPTCLPFNLHSHYSIRILPFISFNPSKFHQLHNYVSKQRSIQYRQSSISIQRWHIYIYKQSNKLRTGTRYSDQSGLLVSQWAKTSLDSHSTRSLLYNWPGGKWVNVMPTVTHLTNLIVSYELIKYSAGPKTFWCFCWCSLFPAHT